MRNPILISADVLVLHTNEWMSDWNALCNWMGQQDRNTIRWVDSDIEVPSEEWLSIFVLKFPRITIALVESVYA